MSILTLSLLCVSIVLVSSVITNVIRKISITNELFDIPNSRSSHDVPVPKSGGISIVLTLLAIISLLLFFKMLGVGISISLIIGIAAVAITGLIDDYKNLSVLTRVVAYMVAATLSLYLIGGISSLSINNYSIDLNNYGYVLSVLFVFWITNLYNFMDGTDGFAAVQTICVGLFCGLLFYLSDEISFSIILFSLVSSTIGFLYWNWSPAKIFMGDVGSCAIGFLFGLLSIYTENKGIISIAVWLILLAPFIGDATFTLLKRILNREKWYKAHNSHAYQKLHQSGLTHSKLAIGLLVINIVIIWPFAYFAHSYKNIEFAMLVLAYSLIGIIWLTVQKKHQETSSLLP